MKPPIKIKIETGYITPTGRRSLNGILPALRTTIANLKEGESFMWQDNRPLFRAAKDVKAVITTRKINGDGYRVWRVK